MSTREERLLAGRAVFTKLLLGEVRGIEQAVRDVLEPAIDPDGGVAAELVDGARIGTVKRSKVRKTPKVTDERALLAWVRERRPDMLVESVNEGFVTYLKGRVKLKDNRGLAVLPDGEIVPGVELVDGEPSYLVQPADDAGVLIMSRLVELIGGGMLALPAAPEDEREAS